jgi:hypothetical protein
MADYGAPGTTTGTRAKKDLHETALARFRMCSDAFREQTDRERDDLAFQIPENHWPSDWQDARKGQIINGVPVPPRPMLSIPKLDQTFQMLDNQMRTASLGIQIHAETDDADEATARIIQDLYRHIETTSRANLARNWAYQRAYKCGRGAYKIDKVYDLDSPVPGDQKIVIKRLLDQSCALFDPFATEPDFSDMRFAFETTWMPASLYEDKYPDSKLTGMGGGELEALSIQQPDWVTNDEEGRAYLVAGYWCVHVTKAAQGETRHVTYTVLNAVEILEPETEWDGKYIPLVPVIGRELIPFDGSRRWTGVIGPAKDGQRLFDVAASNVVEKVGLDTKAPWIAAEGQDEGHELEWQMSAVRNFPMLTYKPVMIQGQPVPPPAKNTSGVNISGDLQLLQLAGGFIQDATTTVDQSRLESLAKSRVAHQTIGTIAGAGEASRSDFLHNFVDISLPYEALVILDLIPKVYDRPGRVIRIRSADNKTRGVMINYPYTQQPGGKPQPVPPGMPPPPNAQYHDLSRGVYGVVATVGQGYASANEAQSAQYADLFKADPQVMPAFLPFFLRANNFPPEAVERAEKMVPPQLQDQPQQSPQQLQAQIGQMQTSMQQLQQQLQQANQALQTDQVKVQGDIQRAQITADKDIQIQVMRDATQIAVAKIQAAARGAIVQMEAQNEATALGLQHVFDAQESQYDRAHEAGLSAADASGALASAQDDRAHQVGMAAAAAAQARQGSEDDRLHQGAMAANQAGHEAGMAAAQPPPLPAPGGPPPGPEPPE